MGVKQHGLSTRFICFALVCLSYMALPSPVNAAQDVTPDISLVSSWPAEGIEIWIPSKEGKLVFSGPVNPSTAEYELINVKSTALGIFEIERVAYGVSADTVLFKLPELVPGVYELNWSIQTTMKETLKGTIKFSVEEELIAPGGANHRMDGTSIVPESRTNFLLKIGILAIVSLLGAVYRYRRLSSREKIKADATSTFFYGVSGGIISLLGLLGILSTLYASLERQKHIDSLEHYILAFTAPLLWVYVLAFILGAYYALRKSLANPMYGVSLMSLFFATASSSDFSSIEYIRFALDVALFVSVSHVAYHVYQMSATALLRKTGYRDVPKLLYWFVSATSCSVISVFAQANFHALVGFHVQSMQNRLLLGLLGATLLLVIYLTNRVLVNDGKISLLRLLLPGPVAIFAFALLVVGFALAVAPPVVPGL